MTKIRLSRKGRVNEPYYDIIVADSRCRRDGKFIEKLGYYDPKRKIVKADVQRLEYWQKTGAQCTDRINYIIKKHIQVA